MWRMQLTIYTAKQAQTRPRASGKRILNERILWMTCWQKGCTNKYPSVYKEILQKF